MRTDFIWLDPAKAEVVGLSGYRTDTRTETCWRAKRIRHPDLPGVRWMRLNQKQSGWYSRYTQALAYGGSIAEVYFLPTQKAWEQRQQRLAEAA